MKQDLLNLIEQTNEIQSYFHINGDFINSVNIISDVPQFNSWLAKIQFELNVIYNKTYNKLIADTLTISKSFEYWSEQDTFMKLKSNLMEIQKNIDEYYQNEKETISMSQKTPKIFISHSSLDKEFIEALVELLEFIGLNNKQQLICTSISGYGIPLGKDIYEYLKEQFYDHDLHLIFVLSDNYYHSVPCLNEMGAAWVLQKKYTTILLPGFEFEEIKGAINPRQIGLKLDAEPIDIKDKLGQLKNTILKEFNLPLIDEARWETKRDNFIKTVSKISMKDSATPMDSSVKSMFQFTNSDPLSEESLSLLKAACSDQNGHILKIRTTSGSSITSNNKSFIPSQDPREVATWEDALEKLIILRLITQKDKKGEVYGVTKKGYDYIKQLQKIKEGS